MVLQPLSFHGLRLRRWGSPVGTSINCPGSWCRGTSSSGDDLSNFITYMLSILKRTYKGVRVIATYFFLTAKSASAVTCKDLTVLKNPRNWEGGSSVCPHPSFSLHAYCVRVSILSLKSLWLFTLFSLCIHHKNV